MASLPDSLCSPQSAMSRFTHCWSPIRVFSHSSCRPNQRRMPASKLVSSRPHHRSLGGGQVDNCTEIFFGACTVPAEPVPLFLLSHGCRCGGNTRTMADATDGLA